MKYRLNDDLGYNRKLATKSGQALAGLRYLATRSGPLATPTFDILAFLKSDPDIERVDGQMLMGPFTIPAYNAGEPVAMERAPGMSALGFVLRPTSEGTVSITSAEPGTPVRIEANYFSSAYDRTTGANLLRRMRELFAQSPIADRISHETFPGTDVQSDDELIDSALDGGLHRLSRDSQLRHGARPRATSWTADSRFAGWTPCEWWTARSCRSCCPATSTGRSWRWHGAPRISSSKTARLTAHKARHPASRLARGVPRQEVVLRRRTGRRPSPWPTPRRSP